MNNFVSIKGKYAKHWFRNLARVHEREAEANSITPYILAVDPSWLTGYALIGSNFEKCWIRSFGIIDVRDKKKVSTTVASKILRVGKGIDEIIEMFDPRWIAVEIPIIGRGHPVNNAIIGQARLVQHIFDRSPALYHKENSEIHQATAKSAVLQPGDQKRGNNVKEKVVERVRDLVNIDLDFGLTKGEERKFRQAVSDAIAIGMAFFRKVR